MQEKQPCWTSEMKSGAHSVSARPAALSSARWPGRRWSGQSRLPLSQAFSSSQAFWNPRPEGTAGMGPTHGPAEGKNSAVAYMWGMNQGRGAAGERHWSSRLPMQDWEFYCASALLWEVVSMVFRLGLGNDSLWFHSFEFHYSNYRTLIMIRG